MESKSITNYCCELNQEQILAFHDWLEARGATFRELPYGHWQGRLEKTSISAYLSGKCTIQGKGSEEIVLYYLEPEVLKEAKLGYTSSPTANASAVLIQEPHAGIDESGKGDYFGPLVIAAAYVDQDLMTPLAALKVRDSKLIKSEKELMRIATGLRQVLGSRFAVVTIGNESYNRLYASMNNLNRLLAWGHARALENLLEKVPSCTAAISDKFGDERLIQNALQQKGRRITLTQVTKGERDLAVAAASILARAQYLMQMKKMSEKSGLELPRGAGPKVTAAAQEWVLRHGVEALGTVAKLHFCTSHDVIKRGE